MQSDGARLLECVERRSDRISFLFWKGHTLSGLYGALPRKQGWESSWVLQWPTREMTMAWSRIVAMELERRRWIPDGTQRRSELGVPKRYTGRERRGWLTGWWPKRQRGSWSCSRVRKESGGAGSGARGRNQSLYCNKAHFVFYFYFYHMLYIRNAYFSPRIEAVSMSKLSFP